MSKYLSFSLLLFLLATSICGQDLREDRASKSKSFIGVDVGTSIWLERGKSPSNNDESYSMRPWGSWHLGLNWMNNTKITGPLYIDWGGGVKWLSWRLEDSNYFVQKGANSVEFIEIADPDISPIKSRLSSAYVSLFVVPMLDFGKSDYEPTRDENSVASKGFKSGLRLGVGPFVDYRIASSSKYVFTKDGNRDNTKTNDHFFLRNARYGFRAQVGYREMEFFATYDLNEVFTNNKGPNGAKLHVFSIGVSLVGEGI